MTSASGALGLDTEITLLGGVGVLVRDSAARGRTQRLADINLTAALVVVFFSSGQSSATSATEHGATRSTNSRTRIGEPGSRWLCSSAGRSAALAYFSPGSWSASCCDHVVGTLEPRIRGPRCGRSPFKKTG